MNKQKIYFISGLGANEKAFAKLADFGKPKVMVKWLANEKNETLENYANRLIEKYSITQQDILVGLSFGGLLAQQIAHTLQINEVILISSFRTKKDLRTYLKLGLNLKLHKLIPPFNIPIISTIVVGFLNSVSKESTPLLKNMLKETDYKLAKWSIEKISERKTVINSELKLYNIIGLNDRIMKPWQNESTFKIDGGSHFMVYDESVKVSEIIQKIVSEGF